MQEVRQCHAETGIRINNRRLRPQPSRPSASEAISPRSIATARPPDLLFLQQPFREATMKTLSALASILLATTASVGAAEVTFERLSHPEPQNWLMNHHDFGAHRYSMLDAINKANVRNLRLAFAIALGGTSGTENLEATPLIEDGFMYMSDAWGVVYKIDVRSGRRGDIVWKMNPKQEKI